MNIAAALVLGLLIGSVLAALGGGGAILTVPLLVYVLGQSPQDATTSSLVIVGLTSGAAALGHSRAGHVRWSTAGAFGVTGVAGAYAGTALNHRIAEHVLLIGFSAVMIAAATAMLRRAGQEARRPDPPPPAAAGPRPSGPTASIAVVAEPVRAPAEAGARGPYLRRGGRIAAAGLGVGFLTGLFGVGGGFVVVPALALTLGLPMPVSVGTSLLVIALNSATALAARTGTAHFDWEVILPCAAAAMAATVLGRRIAGRLPDSTLNRAFAVLLLLVAAFVGLHNAVALAR